MFGRCPYFCNELGGEGDRIIALTRDCSSSVLLLSTLTAPASSSTTTASSTTASPDEESGSRVLPSKKNQLVGGSTGLNQQYISNNPCQYLHRPASAATVGVLEPLQEGLMPPPLDSAGTVEATSSGVASRSEITSGAAGKGTSSSSTLVNALAPGFGLGVMKQEMCPYVKTALRIEELDCGTAYYKTYFCGRGEWVVAFVVVWYHLIYGERRMVSAVLKLA